MKIYMAPLEGITGWIYRNALKECFGGFDKYFIPFIHPNQKGHFSSRERKDILPEHNQGMDAVPQILTNQVDDFVRTAGKLSEYGYREINLNLGCPSKTVVTRGRGAGFLADPDRLDRFLEEVFEDRAFRESGMRVSIKTRIGMADPEEFGRLLAVYSQYPLEELIVHPRLQTDYYKNHPDLDAFSLAVGLQDHWPVCYNGDICSPGDLEQIKTRFPSVPCVMTGRGVLADPSLGRRIKGGAGLEKGELRRFHDLIYQAYCEEMSGDRTILYKMKELWFYLAPVFTESKKYGKKIKKCEKCAVYESVVEELFEKERIRALTPGSEPAE